MYDSTYLPTLSQGAAEIYVEMRVSDDTSGTRGTMGASGGCSPDKTGPGTMSERVMIYTDGACSGNPGPGGWGAILRFGGVERELSGGEPLTTNNRMEMTAAIAGLNALKRPCTVDLFTDSQYLMQGMTTWIENWKRRGWKTADNKPVKNEELWRALDEATGRHEVTWHWVRGHADDALNNRVDALAVAAMQQFRNVRDPGSRAGAGRDPPR